MKQVAGVFAAMALAVGLGVAAGGAAMAEEWTDYTPVKGVWLKTGMHVDRGRLDDYLVGLKKTWVPEMENLKKHGLIDRYFVQVAVTSTNSGPNVLLGEHFTSMATFDPDKVRDQAIRREEEAMLPKAEGEAVRAERAKYRTFVSEEMWTEVDLTK